MWYGVFLWAVVSSLVFHLPAALLALATLRQHKVARFMPIAIMLMSILGPLCGGVLTSEYPETVRPTNVTLRSDSRCVQSSGEEDDVSGGLGVWSGAVFLCAGHLLLQGSGYPIAPVGGGAPAFAVNVVDRIQPVLSCRGTSHASTPAPTEALSPNFGHVPP
ncbi:hypothetical protein JZ751_029988 [Albula glossodonta]|uniref:Transmembrane protein 170A n=1 Tax=Albula glossodonta TaxID=121402 RepID=A0A8T2NCE8_9TELE|nr:hypothetical protein JZ751_029988 [Albula glossodonta]